MQAFSILGLRKIFFCKSGEKMFFGKKSILIVDSDKAILRVFRLLLEEKGYQVVTAETGKEATQKLHDYSFDAALMDRSS